MIDSTMGHRETGVGSSPTFVAGPGGLPPAEIRQTTVPAIRRAARSLQIENLSAWYGTLRALDEINLTIQPNKITALIGPSGCGKTTLLRCLNRMHEVTPGRPRVQGRILLDGEDIMAQGVDPTQVRRLIGMVFQKPNPFPMMSIYDNVVSGFKLNGRSSKKALDGIVEQSLRAAALWDEVKDKLRASGTSLSGGQQQRLCIARAIAVQPEIILMDEPCSALDPIATYKIEELMTDLAKDFTIAIVTHNMQQASRVADYTAFLLAGEDRSGRVVEYGPTDRIFTAPVDKRTEDYITGRFG